MKCPRCQNKAEVVTTKPVGQDTIVRYRKCCLGHHSTTHESFKLDKEPIK